jgi:alpha-tubulin suppressor-like RCC1 family protein
MANSLVPVAVTKTGVLSGKTIKQISAGEWHTCAIASDDLAYCWAYSEYGQLGDPTTMALGDSPDPVAVVTSGVLSGKTIKQISAGGSTTYAIASDDKAYCWGQNWAGALGNNSTTDSGNPVAVNTAGVLAGKTIKQIATGGSHTCVIASDDKVYCWGYNEYGELGNNSTTNSLVPVAVNTAGVLSGKTVKQLDVSSEHTCVIASDDKVYCWGRNRRGQIGDGTNTDRLVPVAVTDGGLSSMTIKQVQVAYNHSCAIASDNNYYCWGRSNYAGG